jgi:hypothetical protein
MILAGSPRTLPASVSEKLKIWDILIVLKGKTSGKKLFMNAQIA